MAETVLIEIVYSTREQGLDCNVKSGAHGETIESCRLDLIDLFKKWVDALENGKWPFPFPKESDDG
jgi:hypothetical protein